MGSVTRQGLAWLSACRLRPWLWAALLAAWLIWLGVITLSTRLIGVHAYDFNTYYTASQALRYDRNATIYNIATLNQVAQAHGVCVHSGHVLPPYVYPPLLAILLEPLTLLPCGSAAMVWLWINAAEWMAATLLLSDILARRWPGRRLEATVLMTLVSVCCLPAYYGLFLGQVHLLLLVGLALTLWLVERDHPALAGGALAVITVIKLFPALLLVYYLMRGRWRLIGAAALVGAALLVVMLVGSSPITVARSLPAGEALLSNRLIANINEALIATMPPALHLVGLALEGLATLLWLTALWRRRGARGDDDSGLLAVGWTLCVMLLVLPLVWSFYLIWLAPTFCACWAALGPPHRASARGRLAWLALAALYVVLDLPLLGLAHPLATLGLWAITGALYWRATAPSAPSEPRLDAMLAVSAPAAAQAIPGRRPAPGQRAAR